MNVSRLIVLMSKYGPEICPPLEVGYWSVSGSDGTHVITFASETMRFQSDTTTPQLIVQATGLLTVGKRYRVQLYVGAYTSGAIKSDSFSGSPILANSAGMTQAAILTATNTTFQITRNTSNVDLTIYGLSIKPVRG